LRGNQRATSRLEVGVRLSRIGQFLYRRAENLLALMLAVMFLAFILQIVFRYLLNWPIGWTSELTVIMWLWLVLWGAAFVLREDEEIRFDLIYGAVRPKVRRGMIVVASLALIGLYLLSLPAVVDYVTFMKVQSTAYMKIRFDYLFSIYVLFAIAALVRYGWILAQALRGRSEDLDDPSHPGSGL
jgi:TRAP-type C4-dicarboxylate transport system permease small subunit